MTSTLLTCLIRSVAISTLLGLLPLSTGWASTFELDIHELEKTQPTRKEPKKHTPSAKRSQPARKTESAGSSGSVEGERKYTVKQGDHIFKILMKELGLSNDDAERLIPTVANLNHLKDVRRLSVGQVLLLPTGKEGRRKQLTERQEDGGKPAVRKRKAEAAVAPVVSPAPPAEPARQEASSETKTPEPPPVASQAALEASPAPQPAPEPPSAPQPSVSEGPVKMWPIPSASTEEMVDGLLKALEIKADKQRIVETSSGNGSVLSIKVDRYFENGGKRIIVNCSSKDQFNYTLLRLMEREGYQVIQAERLDFKKTAESLLAQLGLPYDYVVRKDGGATRELSGYLVGDGKADRQLFLTESSAK